MKATLFRIVSGFPLRAERWERHKSLRLSIGLGLFICSLLAAAKWYDWARGQGALYVPILWTIAAVLLVLVAPRRRILVGGCLLLYLFYGAKGVLLNQDPRTALIMGVVALVLFFILIITVPSDWH